MLRKTAILAIAAALGTGAAIGIAACGEDRDGDVTFENGGGTESTGTGTETGAATGTTGTTATETTPKTTPTETSP
jgi:hypothetical protein